MKIVKCYRDLVNNSKGKYAVKRLATSEEIEEENARRVCNLTEGKTLVVQEVYAPGGYVQGVLTTKPEIVRGQHELEEVERL